MPYETIIEIIISEAQNEVADFEKWDFDIIPHRASMKRGFETADGQRVEVESVSKNPQHPFRVATVWTLPEPPYTATDKEQMAKRVYPPHLAAERGQTVSCNRCLRSSSADEFV
jgi:hypothetical protein